MKNQTMTELWKRYAQTYGQANDLESRIRSRIIEVVASSTASHAHVVELGCGNGAIIKKLSEKRPDLSILGIDSSRAMLDVAKQSIHENTTLNEDTLEHWLVTNNQQFDFIIIGNTLHNLPNKKIMEETIIKALDHLTPTGKLLFDIRNSDNPFIRKGYKQNRAKGLTFHSVNKQWVRNVLKKSNGKLLSIESFSYESPKEAGKETLRGIRSFLYQIYILLTQIPFLAPYKLCLVEKRSRSSLR